ncbi:LysR family transcriptional regulator [Vibrio hannami]|uniref:LysR family transcriptional regulator n=1 Tax=Vibrio hannami TaxID=2717094 RepID=UPI00240FDD71|nr:LysR family transcriptional regulator [Vibrio hannami]MDG3084935.1 LysR family transcriptional regulator [Vibrio hannami]
MKNTNKIEKEPSDIGKQIPRDWVWDDVRTFLAIARSGTLSGAASELNLGIATLSRRIERLETALNLPLFVRFQSGYQLTEDGASLIEKAEAIEAATIVFESNASLQSQLSGRVRLATAENLANHLIIPALPEFQRQYPAITIEFVTDISTANLHRRDADLALRMVRPVRGNVTLRRVGELGYGLYGSAHYVDQRQKLVDSATFDADDFISWGEMQTQLPAAHWLESVLQGREPVLTTTSLASQVAATKAGLGLAVLPHLLGNLYNFVCVEKDIGINQTIYLVMHSDLSHSRRVRAVADFLVELVESNRPILSGNH